VSISLEPPPRVVQPPPDVAAHEIGHSLKRGAMWTLGSQLAAQALRLASVVVLARLLTPDDYGAAALAITISTYSMILGDFGYGTALVQSSTASQRRASTAFWCALAAGAIGAGCVALAAYPAARAFDEPQVAGLVIGGGLTLFLVGVGSASNALLTRSMRFRAIQTATLVASIAATACGITAAALGAGPWALVLPQIVLALLTSAAFILAARWRPSLEFSRSAFRSLSAFAFPFTGGSAFFVLHGVVAVVVIGQVAGLADLGIWNLSMAIVIVPMSLLAAPISRVIYAAFARMRDDSERIAELWLRGFALMAAVLLPTFFGLIALAPDLIPFVFGEQWVAAVPVVQTLCALVMVRSLQTWNEPVMDSAGRPQVAMFLTGSVLLALPPCIWLGSKFGIEGIAVGYCFAALVGELLSFLITTRQLSLKPLTVLRSLRGILPSAVAACLGVVLARSALEDLGVSLELRLLISIVVGVSIYVPCLALFSRSVAVELLWIARGLGLKTRRSPS
jgi:teichuronic acid exporter